MTIDVKQPYPVVEERTLLNLTWVFFSLAFVFTSMRMTVRLYVFRKLMWDDYWVLFALLLLLGNAIATTIMIPRMYDLINVSLGLEKPGPDFVDRTTVYMKTQLVTTLLFWSCLWAVKAGFLCFFRRLTSGLNKWYTVSWWFITVTTLLTYFATMSTYPLSCSSFDPVKCDDPWHVRNSIVSFRFSTAVDVITDAMIIALPLALCLRVRVRCAQKIALGGVFSLGFLIMIFSILRISISNHSGWHPEITWLALWSNIECSIAVVVICTISFRAFFIYRKGGMEGYYYETGGRSSVAADVPGEWDTGFRELSSSHAGGNGGPEEGSVGVVPLANLQEPKPVVFNPMSTVDREGKLAAYNTTRRLDDIDDQERRVAAFNATRPLDSNSSNDSNAWPLSRA